MQWYLTVDEKAIVLLTHSSHDYDFLALFSDFQIQNHRNWKVKKQGHEIAVSSKDNKDQPKTSV